MKRLLSIMRLVLWMMLVVGVLFAVNIFALQFIVNIAAPEWIRWLAVIFWCYFIVVLAVYLSQTDTGTKAFGRWFDL